MLASLLRDRPVALLATVGVLALLAIFFGHRPEETVYFTRDVRPILNEHCVGCHGGVKKQGGLSLIFEEEALAALESGRRAVVPGRPESSEILRRVRHADPEERMPPESPPLTEQQIDVLERWIRQGARWQTHWAYEPLQPAEPPSDGGGWARNGIDRFVARKLGERGLDPVEEASCTTLLRRVSLDLVGLPPAWGAVESTCRTWEAGGSAERDALYRSWVDSLLRAPAYGEHWAAFWLDLARYADTKGYEKDGYREIWRYRDWLIEAFNADAGFDRFTVEQLAGDLLPDRDASTLLATAFHRNTMTNDEGGTDDEEFRVAAVIDRINTTMEVWQGTTMGCVQCHDHPYDPFRQSEYYELYAFFNTTADADRPDEAPTLATYGPADRPAVDSLLAWLQAHDPTFRDAERPIRAERVEAALYPEGRIEAASANELSGATRRGGRLGSIRHGGYMGFHSVDLSGVAELVVSYSSGALGGTVEVRRGGPGGRKVMEFDLEPTGGWEDRRVRRVPWPATSGRSDLYFVFRRRGDGELFDLFWLYFDRVPDREGVDLEERSRVKARLAAFETSRTPVLQELPTDTTRVTRVFDRGNFLSPTDTVAPHVPDVWPALEEGAPRNRLGFARWLVADANPLTARVAVNRFWARIFGRGLVETLEDFGSQGSPPSHPELLDWLAYRFMHTHAWSVKGLLREIVTSATYRQSSRIDPDRLAADPQNRLLGRGARVRLSAEQVRDGALAVSGLLSDRMFGPSVMPPQPPGIWNSPYSGAVWQTSEGEDRYRRALYTFWKRTAPYPSMVTFDAPSREVCVSRRVQTNTPLQALVLLNDTVYVEAAGALASRMEDEVEEGVTEQIRYGYRLALQREPGPVVLETLRALYDDARSEYRGLPDETPVRPAALGPETAHVRALAVVGNAILNLDAFVMKD